MGAWRTAAVTGPTPINIDFMNDAIGGSASNALLSASYLSVVKYSSNVSYVVCSHAKIVIECSIFVAICKQRTPQRLSLCRRCGTTQGVFAGAPISEFKMTFAIVV